MRFGHRCFSAVAALMSATALPALAEEVRIYSPDGEVEMFGELLEVRENEFVIQSAVGPMTVDRSKVLCEGAACPQAPEEATKEVRIYSEDGAINMTAELLDVRENELVVRTAVGPMAIDRSKVICEGPACPAEANAEPETRVVQLTSVDGTITMSGELLEVQPDKFVIQTAVGPMSVERSSVACEGAACPEVEQTLTADYVFAGAEEMGRDLMPGLWTAYAESLGGSIVGPISVDAQTAQYSIKSATGERLFTVELRSNGSSDGLSSLVNGEAQVAMSLRPANREEIIALRRAGRGNLQDFRQEYVIGSDSLVVVVSPRLPIEALSLAQISGVYSGQYTNWSEIGGPNLPITALSREEASLSRELFDQFIFGDVSQLTSSAIILDSSRDVASWVASEPDSIGYVSVDNIREAKPIDLTLSCGLALSTSPFKTKAEEYSLGGRIRLYTDNTEKDEFLQGFLDFVISAEADPAFTAAGYVGQGIAIDDQALRSRVEHATDESDPRELSLMVEELEGAARLSMTFRFDAGSPRLDNKALRDLERLADFLAEPENGGKEIIFVGFADALGAESYNKTLSAERAQTVLDQLRTVAGGRLDAANLVATGFGELAPVACNDNVQGRSINRRVEVWIR